MSTITLSEALKLYLLEDRAPSTIATYKKVLGPAIEFFGPKRPVDLVTREDVLRYVEYLRNQTVRYENHPRRQAERGGLSPRTIEKRVKTVVSFFNWMVENGYLEENPAGRLKLRRYQRPPGSSKAATPRELQAILEVAEAKARLGNKKHLAIFLFLADTGCRAGEAASVQIANMRLSQFGAWVLGKGDKLRPVFFGSRTAQALHEWLKVHPNPVADSSLFGMNSESISHMVARMAQVAGIERPIYAHAIRHRVGQVWSSAKMGEQATQLKLGHDDPTVTIEMYYNQTYNHVQQASLDLSLASIFGISSEPTQLTGPVFTPLTKPKQAFS